MNPGMMESLFQIEIFRENDIFYAKVHTQDGPREYQNDDYTELVTDMFVDLQDEDMLKTEQE
jgi:hypothetical protein